MEAKISFDTFYKLHEWQLKLSKIPEQFHKTLHEKLMNETFDAGCSFTLLKIDYEEDTKSPSDPAFQLQVIAEEGIKVDDPRHIYLVDHLWTFKAEDANKELLENSALRERLAGLMGLEIEEDAVAASETIFNELWKYCDMYFYSQAENIEDRLSYWYVMDEVGSAITHNDVDPNFRMVPFFYIPKGITFSVIFPILNLEEGEFVTRNRDESERGDNEKKAALLPWKYQDFSGESSEHFKPSEDYFSKGHIAESLPIMERFNNAISKKKIVYKVYAEYSVLRDNLTDKQFEIVEEDEEADILWYSKHFTDFEKLSETPEKFVNQFPYEHVITVKDLLAITCRRKLGDRNEILDETRPKWLPTCYNLREEILPFLSYFQKREKEGLDNVWIVKPYNLARGLDIYITNNLNYIMRLATTGPKIAQKYITNPVVFHRPDLDAKVKFDIRYIVLLKSVKPLKIYAYKNFFLRFANRAFALNNFNEYEQHFTVMNYKSDVQLKKMLCADFKVEWEKQYPGNPWISVEKAIYQMMREVFECAVMEKPPMGIGDSPQSRTLFGFDVMVSWGPGGEVLPQLLEVNWVPDCKRACDYYPDFYNDIFKLLFLDEENNDVFETL